MKDSRMAKITSCGGLFASLSYHGEVYIFSPSANPSSSANTVAGGNNTVGAASSSSANMHAQDGENGASSRSGGPFKCQRVWALRKKSSAVKDVALGVDGSIIICTESGHVFVRTRNATKLSTPSSLSLFASSSLTSSPLASSNTTSQKTFRFHRVPFLQRVIRVCANSAGAFGALRVEVPVKEIEVRGDMVSVELGRVGPWLAFGKKEEDDGIDVFGWKDKLADTGDLGAAAQKLRNVGADSDNEDIEGEMEDEAIGGDIRALKEICDAIKREVRMRADDEEEGGEVEGGTKLEERSLPHGADTLVVCEQSGAVFPVHKVVLVARSKVLCRILSSTKAPLSSVRDAQSNIEINSLPPPPRRRHSSSRSGPGTKSLSRLRIARAGPLAILIVLTYLYSNNVITIWDRRIAIAVAPYAQQQLKLSQSKKWDVGKIRNEVAGLARVLELRDVLIALERPVKVVLSSQAGIMKDLMRVFDIVNPSLRRERDKDEMDDSAERAEEAEGEEVYEGAEGAEAKAEVEIPAALRPDIILELEDREVCTHSVILRARSELFKCFFDEPDWTRDRWVEDNTYIGNDVGGGGLVLRVNLRHLKWRVMEFVLRFMCCGCDKEIFEMLEFVKSVDDLIEFMFEVMAAANELLLDRLVLLCSDIILTYSSIHNACYVLSEATHFSATQLIDRIQSYITANMELFLESHMLDDIPQELVLQLARYAQRKQREKAPYVRGGELVTGAMVKWLDWVEEQDIPVPFVRSGKPWKEKKTALPIPKFENRKKEGRAVEKGLRKPSSADDLFVMDDTEGSLQVQAPTQAVGGGPAWRVYVAPKVDMKVVMAEAAQDQMRVNLADVKSPDTPRAPSKQPQRTPSTTSPTMVGKGSSWIAGSPRKTRASQLQGPQQQGSGTSNVPLLGPLFQPSSTPQKSKDSMRPIASGSQGRVSSVGQVPNTVTPTKQGTASDASSGPGAASSGPVMGPTITPMRMPASTPKGSGEQRNVSYVSSFLGYIWMRFNFMNIRGSGKAWAYAWPTDTLTPIVPASQNTFKATASRITSTSDADTSNTKSVSFLAIQHSQQEEQLSLGDLHKDRRSLVEIQEEEKARREEENFLRWWQEEEARVKLEMEALEAFKQGGSPSGKQRRDTGGGRGRGGGGGGEHTERGGGRGRGGGAGGSRRGGPKGRKEGRRANQANATNSEGQQVADDNVPSQSQPSDGNIAMLSATPGQNNPRLPRYHKNPHHHPRHQVNTASGST